VTAIPRATLAGDAPEPVRRIVRIYNEAAGLLEAKLRRTPSVVWVKTNAAPVADTAFAVFHSLGRVRKAFSWQAQSAASCYATESDMNEWTEQLIKIRCNVDSAPLLIRIEV
jgi:hypothetical protein